MGAGLNAILNCMWYMLNMLGGCLVTLHLPLGEIIILYHVQCIMFLSGDGHYSVTFTPTGPGVHLIRPMYGGRDVRGMYMYLHVCTNSSLCADSHYNASLLFYSMAFDAFDKSPTSFVRSVE